MRMKCSVSITCVTLVGLIVQSTHGLADVEARVSYEGQNTYMIDITFSREYFSKFFQCLYSGNTTECSAKYRNNRNGNSVYEVDHQGNEDKSLLPCKLYQCKNSGRFSSLICTKLNQKETTCASLINATFISVGYATACVGVSWTLVEEYLRLNNPKIGYRFCQNDCCSDSTTSLQIEESTLAYNASMLQSDSEESFRDLYIVCGIAGGIFLVTFIVFIIILLLRRHVKSALQDGRSTHSPERAPHTTEERVKRGKGISKHTGTRNDQIDPAASFDEFLYSIQQRSHGHAKEETGKHKAKSNISAINQNGASSGTQFFTQAGMSSNDPDSLSDHYRNSYNYEEDYAEIDETQIKMNEPEPFYQNSPQILNDGTDVSLDNTANDGYSSLGNAEYFNTQDVSSSSEQSQTKSVDAAKDIKSHSQADIQKNDDRRAKQNSAFSNRTQSPSDDFSDYSIAKSINNDESNDDIDASIERSQTDSSISRIIASTEGDHSNESRDSPKKHSEQEEEIPTATKPTSHKKRNTYFELEKEKDV